MRIIPTTPIVVERDSGSFQIRAQKPRNELVAGGLAMEWLISKGLDADSPEKSWQQTAARQNLFRRFQRQPNDVAERSRIRGHNQVAVLLNAVTARFIQRVHARKIVFNHGFVERLERYVARRAVVDLQPIVHSAH